MSIESGVSSGFHLGPFYYEKTTFIMVASVMGAVLNIILNYVFIRLFGYLAAGYTTLLCYIVYAIAHYLFMRKVCRCFCEDKQPYDPKIIFIISFIFVFTGFLLMITYDYPLVRYSIVVVLSIVLVVKRKKIIDTIKKIIGLRST